MRLQGWVLGSVSGLLFLLLAFASMAEEALTGPDQLLERGDIQSVREAVLHYVRAAQANEESYEANWKCARAHAVYANRAFQRDLDGWKGICERYGKEGMKYGKKAIQLAPDRVEGNYYYGLCVKSYADAVSVLTALAEGLKGSTQKAFETAYKLDKMYENGGPIKAIGRFWFVLPWPLKDRNDSLTYFEEHHKYFPEDPEGEVWYAEALIDDGRKGQAKKLLKKASHSDHAYYSKRAKGLLGENF